MAVRQPLSLVPRLPPLVLSVPLSLPLPLAQVQVPLWVPAWRVPPGLALLPL